MAYNKRIEFARCACPTPKSLRLLLAAHSRRLAFKKLCRNTSRYLGALAGRWWLLES